MVGVYKIIIKDNSVFKYLNDNNEVSSKLNIRLKNKTHRIIFKSI